MVILGVEHATSLDTLMEQALTKTLLVYTVPSHTSIGVTVTLCGTSHQVNDAGLTEVQPGTQTVLAIGGLAEVVDEVTGHLSIY